MQQLQAALRDAAIVEDADVELGLDRGVVAALGEAAFECTRDSNHPGAFVRKLARTIGPAVVPHPVDPALEQRRHRPPVDRKDHHGGVVALDPLHLAPHILGIDLVGIFPIRLIRLAQHRIEPFLRQIGQLERMAVGLRRLAERVGSLTGQRRPARVGDDEKGLHRWAPIDCATSLNGNCRQSNRRTAPTIPIDNPSPAGSFSADNQPEVAADDSALFPPRNDQDLGA